MGALTIFHYLLVTMMTKTMMMMIIIIIIKDEDEDGPFEEIWKSLRWKAQWNRKGTQKLPRRLPGGPPWGFQRAGTRAAQHGPKRPHGPKRLKTVQNCTKSPQTESSQKVPRRLPDTPPDRSQTAPNHPGSQKG